MMPTFKRGRWREHGHAVIEVSLMAPWIFFLFVGTLDLGFYSYAVIATQNAARVAAAQTSATPTTAIDNTLACNFALTELNVLPNTRSLTTCAALPVIVNATSFVDADGATATRVDHHGQRQRRRRRGHEGGAGQGNPRAGDARELRRAV